MDDELRRAEGQGGEASKSKRGNDRSSQARGKEAGEANHGEKGWGGEHRSRRDRSESRPSGKRETANRRRRCTKPRAPPPLHRRVVDVVFSSVIGVASLAVIGADDRMIKKSRANSIERGKINVSSCSIIITGNLNQVLPLFNLVVRAFNLVLPAFNLVLLAFNLVPPKFN